MKLLVFMINGYPHNKNWEAIQRMCKSYNIEFEYTNCINRIKNNDYDILYSMASYINPYESKSSRGPPPPIPQNPRPEMKGPSDINNILSGLKTKNVNIGSSSSATNTNQANEDKGSTISISELKDLQNENMPSRTKRKPKSEKNTISLDI